MIKKWMIDDAGTLINIETRDTYDYVSELVDVLNKQDIMIKSLEKKSQKQDEIVVDLLNKNEQLKEGMIGVVDRYIKNVECNPPSSARTYMKIKRALVNIREDLRNLRGRVE